MKSILVTGVLFLAAAAISAEEEAKSKPPVVSGRPTHADLVKRQAELKKAEAKNGGGKEVAPIGTTKKRGILVKTIMLANGSNWTRLPKGCVIHVPDRYKNKIVTEPQGKLQSWPDFLRRNAGWIHVHSVSKKQAHGLEFLGEEKMKAYKTIGKIVVATYHGNPISVSSKSFIPPVDPPEK